MGFLDPTVAQTELPRKLSCYRYREALVNLYTALYALLASQRGRGLAGDFL